MALQFTEREFIPVLLGGDINAYSVALGVGGQLKSRTAFCR